MAENASSNKERPLAGVVLCFTSILPEQRTELATVASQMGASHKYDLTSDVTHLLVGDINTPKYKFVARERPDVLVLQPQWVQAVRQSWMQGGDTDIRALEQQHRLPTFVGLSICITGFEDMEFRNSLQHAAVSNGAEFKKDLTKNVSHLIARDTQGQKYKFATQWGVKVVTVQWFRDSLERGMVLDESLYHPLLPEEQQGVGAWNRTMPVVKEKPPQNENSANPRPRKIRRIASAKLENQNEGIWGDIVGTGFENPDLRQSTGSQQKEGRRHPRTASIVQEARSFASETRETPSAEPPEPPPQPSKPPVESDEGFLHGCFFFCHGFSSKQANVLRHHLTFNGAQVVGSLGDFSRPDIPKRGHGLFIIVPYTLKRSEIPSTDDLAFECEVVTDMWLERCLDAKALIPPESHVANTPVPRFPLPGLNATRVCSTGFSRIDLLHLSKLVNLVGATYNEYLTPHASVLICNHGPVNPDKLRHTLEWRIPAVNPQWLWDSIKRERKQPFEAYSVRKSSTQNSREGSRSQSGQPEKPHLDSNSHRATQPVRADKIETKSACRDSTHQDSGTDQRPPSRNSVSHRDPDPEPQSKRPSEPQSRVSTTPVSPAKRPASAEPNDTTAPTPLDVAMTGFLKQAREANSRASTNDPDSDANNDGRKRRRKPLLGRAPSHSSVRTGTDQSNPRGGAFASRASSIDTLNEDGTGSAIESMSVNSNPNTSNRNANPNNHETSSLANDKRFDFSLGERPDPDREQSQTPPPMTQLNYEDPDSLAMREKFLKYAGRNVPPNPAKEQNGAVLGEVKELENSGWGNGRRTRGANKVKDVGEDEF